LSELLEEVTKLVEGQGTTEFVALALDELDLQYLTQVRHRSHFLRRVVALFEEAK